MSSFKKLSVVIPVLNEEKTIEEIIRRVERVQLPDLEKEIVEPRPYSQGKKIKWQDGAVMLWTILKWRVLPF